MSSGTSVTSTTCAGKAGQSDSLGDFSLEQQTTLPHGNSRLGPSFRILSSMLEMSIMFSLTCRTIFKLAYMCVSLYVSVHLCVSHETKKGR